MYALKQNHDNQLNKTNDNLTNKHIGDQFFDIIAGVSIRAINAVFLVDYVLKNNGKWDGAYLKLKDFWNNFKAYTYAESNPWFGIMWDSLRFLMAGACFNRGCQKILVVL